MRGKPELSTKESSSLLFLMENGEGHPVSLSVTVLCLLLKENGLL